MSQESRILQFLQKGRTLTHRQAQSLFQCDRLSARIGELRASGHKIATEYVKKNGKRFGRYRLVA